MLLLDRKDAINIMIAERSRLLCMQRTILIKNKVHSCLTGFIGWGTGGKNNLGL